MIKIEIIPKPFPQNLFRDLELDLLIKFNYLRHNLFLKCNQPYCLTRNIGSKCFLLIFHSKWLNAFKILKNCTMA